MPNFPLGTFTGNVWTRSQAEAVMSHGAVSDQVRRGLWQTLLPGVFTDAGHEPDSAQRAWAAVLASGRGSVACGRTAARLWQLPLIDDRDPATQGNDERNHDVAIPTNAPRLVVPGEADITVHRRQLTLTPTELVRHPSGLAVTSPARTLRDLAGLLTQEALTCAVDAALRQGVVTADALQHELQKAKGSRHIAMFRNAVALADAGAESPAETLARLLLMPHLPRLRCQVPVINDWGELIAVLDLADTELMLAVEVDGKRGHAGTQMVAKDRRRDRRTGERGWTTERVTWFELRRLPQQTLARVLGTARALARREGLARPA